MYGAYLCTRFSEKSYSCKVLSTMPQGKGLFYKTILILPCVFVWIYENVERSMNEDV
jgi:hypothetical protein